MTTDRRNPNRGEFQKRDDRGGFSPRGGSRDDRKFSSRGDRDGFKPRRDREDRKEFSPRGERGGFKPGGDRDGFKPREDRGGFKPREDRGGFKPRGDRDGFKPRGDRDGFKPRGDRDGFKPREDRGGFKPREDRGGFKPREDRGGFKPREDRGGFKPREDRGGFKPREDRGGFKPREDRGGFKPREDRGGFKPREDRGGFKPREDRGGFKPREDRGGFKPREDRGGFKPREEFVVLTPEQRAERVEIAKRKELAAQNFRTKQREENSAESMAREIDSILTGKEPKDREKAAEIRRTRREEKAQNKELRLNRFVAQSGVCSRRDADTLIEQGLITVNGEVVREFGVKVTPSVDTVEYDGRKLSGERKVYIIMNKPKGFVTSMDDPHNDKVVIDLLGDKVPQRVYPVGRLDKETTGVLLLTNDGDITRELTHPSFEHRKIYHVFLDKPFNTWDMDELTKGVELEDGMIHADEISYVEGNKKEVGVEIHSGRNRIVRRMFEHLGYRVEKLDRVYFAGFSKMGLRRSHWRYLTPREVTNLLSKNYKKRDK